MSGRSVIDCHTHVFPAAIAGKAVAALRARSHTRPFTDGTADGLCASMRSAGIRLSVILPVATAPHQVVRINDSAMEINRDTGKTGLVSFGAMHPDFEDPARELRRIMAAGIRGIKLHPVYQGCSFDDIRYLRILDLAGELGLTVSVHAGIDIGLPDSPFAAPDRLLRAVRETGPVRLILAHMGGWRMWEQAESLLARENVLLDTSFSLGVMTPDSGWTPPPGESLELMDAGRFTEMVRAFGAGRILFGTDSPWDDQGAAVRRIESLPLTYAEK